MVGHPIRASAMHGPGIGVGGPKVDQVHPLVFHPDQTTEIEERIGEVFVAQVTVDDLELESLIPLARRILAELR